ncbi:MAG: glycosyltransferase family 2 protein, partial [Terracidiphilus sp.]
MACGDEENSVSVRHRKLIAEEGREAQNEKPLLTIAIPTYNRARYLRELLSVLFDQLIDQPQVELIISDNASPDETPALLEEFRQRGLQFLYIRNETNIGADGNILQCFEQAHGKYVWVLSDDDVVVSGGIASILSYIRVDNF